MVSAPFNVKYVDMLEAPDQLQDQIKFPVEHIATMAMEQQEIDPSIATLDHVKGLLQQKTKEVLLCITNSALIVKDCVTKEAMLQIPLTKIITCHHLNKRGSQSNVLKIDAHDQTGHHTHFFQCSRTPAEIICKEINLAKINCSTGNEGKQRKEWLTRQQHLKALQGNWILQSHSNHPPPPSVTPPSLPAGGGCSISAPYPPHDHPTILQGNLQPESPSEVSRGPHQSYSSDGHAESIGQGSEGTSHPNNARDIIKQSSSKNISVLPSRSPGEGGETSEMRRRMKASRIQRDVDILNHVMEDLDDFKYILKSKAAAWADLEKKRKKSRRKKHDAAIEELRLRAEPPSEEEFKEVYRKCKFALNLITKLGHHLSAPSASELQAAIFSHYVSHFVSINKG
ncbi:Epidermal growth factor receptor kinase substrate 8-like protein 1 [Geodia barretti]|nr:Epidermal growth factor receptor kinase substrate 8-like protein 1 [Geodia barretti]